MVPMSVCPSVRHTHDDCDTAVGNKHLHMNRNNRNTKATFKTQNTLAMAKTSTESSYVGLFEKGTGNKRLMM